MKCIVRNKRMMKITGRKGNRNGIHRKTMYLIRFLLHLFHCSSSPFINYLTGGKGKEEQVDGKRREEKKKVARE